MKSFCLLFSVIHYRWETFCSLNEAVNNKHKIDKTHASVDSFISSFCTQNTARACKIFVNKISGFLQKGL